VRQRMKHGIHACQILNHVVDITSGGQQPSTFWLNMPSGAFANGVSERVG